MNLAWTSKANLGRPSWTSKANLGRPIGRPSMEVDDDWVIQEEEDDGIARGLPALASPLGAVASWRTSALPDHEKVPSAWRLEPRRRPPLAADPIHTPQAPPPAHQPTHHHQAPTTTTCLDVQG